MPPLYRTVPDRTVAECKFGQETENRKQQNKTAPSTHQSHEPTPTFELLCSLELPDCEEPSMFHPRKNAENRERNEWSDPEQRASPRKDQAINNSVIYDEEEK